MVIAALHPSRIKTCVKYLLIGDASLENQWRDHQTYAMQELPTCDPRLTTDVYPYRLDKLIHLGAPVRLRPTLQSYAAMSGPLARANRDHLLGDKAPQQILFIKDIVLDGQYPALSDSLSWPILLTHYDVVDIQSSYLVLHRNASPRASRLEPLASIRLKMDETADIPAIPDGAKGIWAKVHYKTAAWGKLRGMLYKRPVAIVNLTNADGDKLAFRLTPRLAEEGFLISPYSVMHPSWYRLATRPAAEKPPASLTLSKIQLTTWPRETGLQSYEDEILVEFFAFYFDAQPRP
jgi:hypothetical protein